jgi:hypothetical protein
MEEHNIIYADSNTNNSFIMITILSLLKRDQPAGKAGIKSEFNEPKQ